MNVASQVSSLTVEENACPCLKKYFNMKYIVSITAFYGRWGMGHEKRENLSLRKNVGNYERPLTKMKFIQTFSIVIAKLMYM